MGENTRMATPYGSGDLSQLFRDFLPHTRAELSAVTGLARSTVGMRLEPLIERGLIVPTRAAQSTGGRPSAQLVLNPSARLVAGVDFGATHGTVGISDLAANVQVSQEEQIPIAEGPEACLHWAIELIVSLLKELDAPTSSLAAVGIGLPGPVEHLTGRPSKPPIMPGWDNFDVPSRVRQDLPDVAVLVDNDVNIMALGERKLNFEDVEHMIFLKVATGIGSGIISNGELVRGAQGTAGDMGHVRLARDLQTPCRCGNYGCLEAVAGAHAVLSATSKQGLELAGVHELIEAVQAGRVEAVQAVRDAGRDIGDVLATCVSMINPSVIVIGGSLSRAGEQLLAGVREVVYGRSTPLATENLQIVQSAAGRQAGIIGASVLAIDYLMAPENVDAWVGQISSPVATETVPLRGSRNSLHVG